MSGQRALWLGIVLLLLLPLLVLLATGYSETGQHGVFSAARAILAELGLRDAEPDQAILRLRLLRALCAVGVGGSLALAGAMTQGLFRNPLAEPGLLGVGSGAMLGACVAIAILGGYGPNVWTSAQAAGTAGSAWNRAVTMGFVPALAFAGAMAAAIIIYRLASRRGRISVSALLLTGLAVNALLGSVMATLQVLLLADYQVSRAILAWGFGTFDDRSVFHVVVAWGGACVALAAAPFVALELDLLAGGEEDAASLGADPQTIKTAVLACAALATAASVSVSGQIAFVGLMVPHLVRLTIGPHHRRLLPISFLAGAVLMVSVIVFQHVLCPAAAGWLQDAGMRRAAVAVLRVTELQPGAFTSLVGAPFFLVLLLRQGRRVLQE
jgi:iron complex transport system permease protein